MGTKRCNKDTENPTRYERSRSHCRMVSMQGDSILSKECVKTNNNTADACESMEVDSRSNIFSWNSNQEINAVDQRLDSEENSAYGTPYFNKSAVVELKNRQLTSSSHAESMRNINYYDRKKNKSCKENALKNHRKTLYMIAQAVGRNNTSLRAPFQRIDNIHQLTTIRQKSILNMSLSAFYSQYFSQSSIK